MAELKKLKFFGSFAEEEMIKNMLEAQGIKSTVNWRGIDFPGDMGDSYGADLFVREEDLEKAREILGEDGKNKRRFNHPRLSE